MKGAFNTGLLSGKVWHQRSEGKHHSFSYPVFYLMLDLSWFVQANLPWCLSLNKWNILSVFEQDYGSSKDLEQHINSTLSEAGLESAPASVRMLTMPRLFGYQFNPITIFYCLDDADCCYAVLYEVHNTFGERHTYVCDMSEQQIDSSHTVQKALHVSPFFDVQGDYFFKPDLHPEIFGLSITYQREPSKPALTATLKLKRSGLSARNLISALMRMPLGPFKVIWAIHYEAFKLWLKRLPVFSKPAPPARAFSINRNQKTHRQ